MGSGLAALYAVYLWNASCEPYRQNKCVWSTKSRIFQTGLPDTEKTLLQEKVTAEDWGLLAPLQEDVGRHEIPAFFCGFLKTDAITLLRYGAKDYLKVSNVWFLTRNPLIWRTFKRHSSKSSQKEQVGWLTHCVKISQQNNCKKSKKKTPGAEAMKTSRIFNSCHFPTWKEIS